MSKTILCQVPRAEHPYYVQDIDLNLYSIEELCCYIDQNLALVDLRFFGESLQAWLREELGLGGLADRLRRFTVMNLAVRLPDEGASPAVKFYLCPVDTHYLYFAASQRRS